MSGGDGKNHSSGAHATGGVKGSSGKGGPSSGKGGYDGHNLGGHTKDNGNGTSTTTDIRVTEHPGGSDLIYYPEGDNDGSTNAIIKEIKEWRTKNGKPGFKKG
ncbi:bacteriocin immunity protein [Klebsiella sp. BIGb0407]|uniref:bacteriocin immunity protein n=1 Tax=Klebsiella sp. BIGb0407 TaxID=2940603 RepID=UPI00216890DD|nr:bacteriocin immunity protein [Klebsiella sp. BIGb0407]MCS3433227.1 hypothetical protein [Klebsiella sp. BIGb0407]